MKNDPAKDGKDRALRVLFVEDSEADVLLLLEALKQGGFKPVRECVATLEGLARALDEKTWDLVLCDYKLPGFTGLDALREFKTRNLDIPFIVVSGVHGEDVAGEVMKAGAHDFLNKNRLARLVPLVDRELKEVDVRKALRQSERRLEMALIGADLGTWDWNIPTNETVYNKRWAEMLGYDLSEIDSKRSTFESLVHPDDLPVAMKALKRHLDGETPFYEAEIRMRSKTGEWIYVLDRGRIVERDKDGRALRAAGTHLDITKRRKADEEARTRQQKLLQADKMISLGTLVSGVAHEINNPNHFIMANASMLMKAWDQMKPILDRYHDEVGDFAIGGMAYSTIRDRIASMFSSILGGSRRIKNIVNELRDYVIERPAGLVEDVQINHVVKSAVTLLTSMVGKSTDRFSMNLGNGLPSVRGSYQRLEQVVINLIQNACQALEDRGQGIEVSTRFDKRRGYVVLEVRDEGVGIPPDALNRVTDLFYTTKRDSGGTGLGLSISSSIVMEHEGELDISSDPGEGTRVRVSLPGIRS